MFNTLVTAADLALHLNDPQWIVFDCRFDLTETEAGRREYTQSHIAGARYAHLDEDLAGVKTGTNGRHPLPAATCFAATLSAPGLNQGMQAFAHATRGRFYATVYS